MARALFIAYYVTNNLKILEQNMKLILFFLIIVVIWFVLQAYILPKLGVST
jgi:predicted membrane protein